MNVLAATPASPLLLLPRVVPNALVATLPCHSTMGNSLALVLDGFAGEELALLQGLARWQGFQLLRWMPFNFIWWPRR